jgi:hypothetical protein
MAALTDITIALAKVHIEAADVLERLGRPANALRDGWDAFTRDNREALMAATDSIERTPRP